ncbi:Ankyrin repeat, PH and SEC7 domain containing protein secG [Cytospora mali]|uniref:Ankyrin repeat, PH and SEC7 domain containing protein secG n=1 Tax=Cytospora mali TaxID=578113 RepID=A0A194UUS4_CYTMA|nr:Ankyrin repeat, PH and SEC7 domain containing protein secG [Valsa mali var. pyri (nom. inval.)]
MHHGRWRNLFGIKHRSRSKASSLERPSTAEPPLPAKSDTAQTTVIEAPQVTSSPTSKSSDLTLPRVSLEPPLDTSVDRGDGANQARARLQQAYEELESVLQARGVPSASRPGLKEILTEENFDLPQATLLQISEEVINDQELSTGKASSKAGAYMQKLFPLFNMALGLTGTLASNFGYGPVQIATNGFAQVLELAISIPEDSEKVVGALNAMAADTRLLSEIKRLPQTAVDEMVATPATELHYKLIVFLRKSIVWLDKGVFRKFAGSLVNPSLVTDAISELQKAREALKTALLSDTYLTVKWNQIATINADTLNTLCPEDYHIAQLMRQKELHNSRLPDSGYWLTDDDRYAMWRAGDRRILWCPGLPGAGKTYLVSRMIDDLESLLRGGNMGLAYVFCEVNRRGQQSERRVLEAFTRQLMARKPKLCQDLAAFLEDPLQTIDDRKSLLKMVLSRFQGSFLVLDALDEFSPDYIDRHSLASSLKNLVEECGDNMVRLCITSRESSGVWEVLCSDSKSAETLNVRSSEEDIRKLVESAYDRTAPAVHWLKNNRELKDLAVERVIARSDCIFKLADLQIKSALRSPSPKAMKEALDALTTDVNEYYEETMERIASQRDTGHIVLDLLTWLTYARMPIYIQELEFALGIEPDKSIEEDFADQLVDLPRFIGLSEGLATLGNTGDSVLDEPTKSDDDGLRVDLAHQSIREFLSTSPRWKRRDGEHFMLARCLTAMTSPIFKSHLIHIWQYAWAQTRSWRPLMDISFIPIKGSPVKVPRFLLWAVLSWGRYLTPTTLDAEIQSMVEEVHRSTDFRVNKRLAWSDGEALELGPRQFAGALYWSAHEGWASACKLVLPLEPDPNIMFEVDTGERTSREYFESAFSAAVRTGDLNVVTIFLDDPKVDPNKGRIDYYEGHITPLMWACQIGHRDMVKLLLERKDVDPNLVDDRSGYGTGRPAILRARASVFDLLLKRADLDVNLESQGRRAIHHLANVGGSSNVLEMLLRDERTDVNARTAATLRGGKYVDERDIKVFEKSRTALMVASLVGHPAQVRLLCEHPDVEVGMHDDDGLTALMLASMGYLRSNNSKDGSVKSNDKGFELQDSIQQHSEVIPILLNIAQINEQDNLGRTALAHAAMCGIDPRTELMKRSSDEDKDYQTWYEDLSERWKTGKKHFVTILKGLLNGDGIEVNIADDKGHTPLDYVICVKGFVVQERDYEFELWTGIFKEYETETTIPKFSIEGMLMEAAAFLSTLEEVKSHLLAAGAQRGKAMGLYTLGPIPGPVIGPITGGFISEYSAWRWVFWSTTVAAITVQAVDRIYKILKAKNNDVGQPEYRLPCMMVGSVVTTVGLFWYGWSIGRTHWIMPNIGALIYTAGTISYLQGMQTYIVDRYQTYAASALATAAILRSLASFSFPLFAPYMYDDLGYGWGTSILAFISIAIGWTAPFLFWFFGPKLRAASRYASS